MIEVEQLGTVHVLHWHDDENRFNRKSVDALNNALDQVEAVEGPCALVTTGEGKFYSNGLDLDWIMGAGDEANGFVDDVHKIFGRILAFPAITVAAINGHAFAGGAMLAAAHDFRVMRSDRGYWCLPEVDLGLPFSDGMTAAVTARLPADAAHDAMITGRRYTAEEALALGIVTDTSDEARLLDLAIDLAAPIAGKDRNVIGEHKRLLFGEAARRCGYEP